ncbi:MAG: hypothetical protein OEY97_10115 [Nitrospirota bacterium]|nr:hypothetical protein [Nitrospirota bacterium]
MRNEWCQQLRTVLLAVAVSGAMLPHPVAAADLTGYDFGSYQVELRLAVPVPVGQYHLTATITHGSFNGAFTRGLSAADPLVYGGQTLTPTGSDRLSADVQVTRTAITFSDPRNPGATWKRDGLSISSLFGLSWVDMQSAVAVPTATPNSTSRDYARGGLHLGVGVNWLPEKKFWGARARALVHADPLSLVDAFSKDPNLKEEYFLAELEALALIRVPGGGEAFAGLALWRYVWNDTLDNSVAKLDMRYLGPMAGVAWHF